MSVSRSCIEIEIDIHGVVNDSHRNQKANNLLFASIYPDRLDLKLVKSFEIDLRQRHVSIGRYFIQETLDRILSDNDLIDFVDVRAKL